MGPGILTSSDTFLPQATNIRQPTSISSIVTDGKKVYVGSLNGTIRGWNLASGKHEGTFSGHRDVVNDMVILNDGTMVSASDDHSVIYWSTKSFDKILKYNGPEKSATSCLVIYDRELATSLKIAKGERVVFGASWDGKVYLWDIDNANPARVLLGHPAPVKKIVYFEGKHGKSLASGCTNGEIWVWDMKNFTIINKIQAHLETVCHLRTHNGLLLSSGKDAACGRRSSKVKIWDSDFKIVNEFETGQDHVNKFFVLQNRFLVTASTKSVEVWDMKSNKEVVERRQNTEIVASIAPMNNDGILIAKSHGVHLIRYLNKKKFLLKVLHNFRGQARYPPVVVKQIYESILGDAEVSLNGIDIRKFTESF